MVTNKPKTKDAATMITKPNGLSANGIPIEATFTFISSLRISKSL